MSSVAVKVLHRHFSSIFASNSTQFWWTSRTLANRAHYLRRMSLSKSITIFMVGDVMLGRGIDQILDHPCNPRIYEGYIKDARSYVALATQQNGPLPEKSEREVSYVWGDGIRIFEEQKPDVKIINLETSVTCAETPWTGKGINYRMNPDNIEVIKSANIDVCVLGNNHVLDWGYDGLDETLATLQNAGIHVVGAGENITEAKKPAVIPVIDKGHVIVFSGGHHSSGVPFDWQATEKKSGVNVFELNSKKSVIEIKKEVEKMKQDGDVIVVSVHWGGNWGWEIEPEQKLFAHRLIDEAHVDIVHGHSSHHVKGIEIYKGKLILYGCGDFLSDYEGITGQGTDHFRDDLSLMYFANVDTSNGHLIGLTMVPTQIYKMRVNAASGEEVDWMEKTMRRECGKFGNHIERNENLLTLVFDKNSKK